MKRLIAFVIIVFVLNPMVLAQPVYFADPDLEAAVEAELAINDPWPLDMLGLTRLYASGYNIDSLTGLEYATNLSYLGLSDNQISSISPLSGLTNLEDICINSNQISSISDLSGLTNLSRLALADNQLSSLSGLSGLTNLSYLYLDYNQISSLSDLSGLTNLGALYCSNNQISSISGLSGLTNLTFLDLSDNQISSISDLSGLTNLEVLDLCNNQVSSLSGLSGLTNLSYLYLDYNQISDISPLSGLTNLAVLLLTGNPLNQDAYDIYIPQIQANGTNVSYDPYVTVTVPDVVGMSETDAGSAITSAGLDVSYRYEYSETVEEGLVISQNPSGGTSMPQGSTVDLVISLGPPAPDAVEVPDVVGMGETEAGSAITSAGLEVSYRYEYSETAEEGLVISQQPAGGTKVPSHTRVLITISRPGVGPPVPGQPAVGPLVAHWKLDETEGGIAYDSVGINNGILMGDPQWSAGVLDGALDFDGDGDYVDCGNDTIFNLTDAFSLTVWINWRTPISDWQTVIAKGDNAWRLARAGFSQTLDFGFTDGGPRGWLSATTASDIPLGEWHHVAATIDTVEGAKIYLDGVLEGTNPDTGGITVGDFPVFIGDNSQQTGRFWDGLIDDVRIYDCVLSESEIIAVMAGVDSTEPEGLIGHWAFDEGAGVIAYDSTGFNDGILMGDPQWSAGVVDGALDFDGDGDYVDCGNDTIFNLTDAFSLAVWINWRTPISDWQTVIAKGDNAWRLARAGFSQTLDFGFTDGGPRGWLSATTASDVPLGEWHHVAATIDTVEGAKIYLDGVLEGTNPDTGGITVGDFPVFIGDNSQQTGRFWDGLIDDVRIYDRALSAEEIASLMQ